jgi:hypothetical protein
MKNYEKQINFLKELGAKKEFFYVISLSKGTIQLQGDLTRDARASMEQYVTLNLVKDRDWLKGEACIDGLNIEVTLTF